MTAQTTTQTQAPARPVLTPVRGSVLQRACACGQHTGSGGECEECKKKREGTLQRAAVNPRAVDEVPASVHAVLRSPGQPLDAETRAFMEPRFGHDFSQVRIHTDAKAAESARAVDALAYAVGRDVAFGAGQYSPKSTAGRQLIAYELTHVLQQSSGAPRGLSGKLQIGEAQDAFEQQADEVATRLVSQPDSAPQRALPHPLPGGLNTVQRRSSRRGRGKAPVSHGVAIVEDGQTAAPGQMQRSHFLTTLRERLIQECDAELAPFGRTARGCPYILRTIERYSSRPVSSLLRLIMHFAHPPAGADANGLIASVTHRARLATRSLAVNGSRRLQAKAKDENDRLAPHDPLTVQAQLGSGQLFAGPLREQMEHSFGTSFGAVRLHTDATATRVSAELGARAFAIGNDIAFAAGQYRPGTLPGDALIAHELAHTVQQRGGLPGASSGNTPDRDLERQADRAAIAALTGSQGAGSSLQNGSGQGLHIQRDGVGEVALAAALLTAEVGGEVAVEEGTVVLISEATAETVAPAVVETLAPTAVETLAPTAVETLAPAAVETTAATSSVASTAATTVGVGVAATTLSSDSPNQSEDNRRKNCFERNPYAIPCLDEISMEEKVQEFIMDRGYDFDSLGNCHGFDSHGPGVIRECNGAPGESWHCDVAPHVDPISRRSLPGGVVSVFSCLCCRADGTTGYEWEGMHWSPGAP